jgi:hypothetical protein
LAGEDERGEAEISVPVTIRKQIVFLGPIPIAKLPKMAWEKMKSDPAESDESRQPDATNDAGNENEAEKPLENADPIIEGNDRDNTAPQDAMPRPTPAE